MPEGPELHLAARYINTVCDGLVFSGKVEKSEVSKNPEVPFSSRRYRICATSRGKEVKLSLTPIKEEKNSTQEQTQTADEEELMDIVFRFGMSGCFRLTPKDEVPKHAHLRFYTDEKPARVLCFIDVRRFGSWVVHGTWQRDRGPCVMLEYEKFRENVTRNLLDKAFDKPICEALLNQKYFNGIGNYLRAEILFRLKIPPFVKARTVLESMVGHPEEMAELTLSKKLKLKKENPDLLELCNLLPLEVINLGGKGYDPQRSNDYSTFQRWLQCYYVTGMNTLRDSNSRTIWFQGDPGPLAPKGEKKKRKQVSPVKSDPDPSHVNVSIPKRKRKPEGSVMKSVSSNKGTPKKVTRKKSRESTTLSVSLSSKRRASVQDSNTPQARGRIQRTKRGSKMVAAKDSPKNTPPVKRRGKKTSMKEDPAAVFENVSRTLQQEIGLIQQSNIDVDPSSVSKTTPNNSQSLNRRTRQLKKEEPAQITETSLQDFKMSQCITQQPKKEEEPMPMTKDPPKDSKMLKGRTRQKAKLNQPVLLIDGPPENFQPAKTRTRQSKNTRASPPILGDVTQNSQLADGNPIEEKDEEASLITKKLLKDSHPLKGRITELKNEEDIFPITGDSLINVPLSKEKKPKSTERKRAGSPIAIRRNPRRVKTE